MSDILPNLDQKVGDDGYLRLVFEGNEPVFSLHLGEPSIRTPQELLHAGFNKDELMQMTRELAQKLMAQTIIPPEQLDSVLLLQSATEIEVTDSVITEEVPSDLLVVGELDLAIIISEPGIEEVLITDSLSSGAQVDESALTLINQEWFLKMEELAIELAAKIQALSDLQGELGGLEEKLHKTDESTHFGQGGSWERRVGPYQPKVRGGEASLSEGRDLIIISGEMDEQRRLDNAETEERLTFQATVLRNKGLLKLALAALESRKPRLRGKKGGYINGDKFVVVFSKNGIYQRDYKIKRSNVDFEWTVPTSKPMEPAQIKALQQAREAFYREFFGTEAEFLKVLKMQINGKSAKSLSVQNDTPTIKEPVEVNFGEELGEELSRSNRVTFAEGKMGPANPKQQRNFDNGARVRKPKFFPKESVQIQDDNKLYSLTDEVDDHQLDSTHPARMEQFHALYGEGY